MAVGAALKSFLTSHPYKNIKCLRYICHVNGLPIEGTVDVLRKSICDFANDNDVDPEATKNTAQEFQENPDECNAKTNVSNQPPDKSSPLLNSSHRVSATDSDLADLDITSDSDDTDDTGSTVTEDDTFRTGQDVSSSDHNNSLTRKVRDLLKSGANKVITITSPKEKNNEIEKLNVESQDDLFEDDELDQSLNMIAQHTQQQSCIKTTLEKICTNLVQTVIQCKDAEIKELKQQNEGLSELNETLSNNCAIILKRYENLAASMTDLKEIVKATNVEVKEIKTTVSQLVEKSTSAPSNSDATHQNQTTTSWQENCSDILLDMAKKIGNLEDKIKSQGQTKSATEHYVRCDEPEERQNENVGDQSHLREADILVVHDSNGNDLEPEKLHHKKKVLKRRRYTLDKAKADIPKVKDPEKVKDVVVACGLNDLKNESPEKTLAKHKDVCDIYTKAFPNAHIHVGAVAPVSRNEINLNNKLKEYAESRKPKYSFIDNQELFDRNTKKLRPKMLNGIHFTDIAFKHVARNIKRSIYAQPHNRDPSQPSRLNQPSIQMQEKPSSEQTLMNAITELTKSTHAILQKVSALN